MKVRDWMSARPHTLTAEATLGDAVALMGRHQFRHVPIVDDQGAVIGMISDRDVKMALGPDAAGMLLEEIDPRQAEGSVSWFMSETAITVQVDAPLAEAARLFVETRVGALPVLDGDKLVGLLSVVDVLRAAAPLL